METIIIAVVTGAASSIATVVALRVDIAWIKLTLEKLDSRITELEKKAA
ncbi:hypothetical protein QNF13_003918 [Vibrio vulnificus]|nr:hypothetical protein [Vibrio vulnificus]EHK9186074.1 hypothetical protein [Vibrio vulnificus]EHZ2765081.1 hypothetical protein [Vibrio vulnificus]EIJ0948373.1 hypothetical protein [Vibrio vulnificus]EIT7142684.1 hypothetical protein [Vibrio vulnificus]EJO2021499.1 hypothetical protein [Vibrio vulnificus]